MKRKRGGSYPRKRGDRFEYRVKRAFEARGCYVIRRAGSKFPDLIVFPPIKNIKVLDVRLAGEKTSIEIQPSVPIVIECKVAKYLTPDDREKIKNMKPFAHVYIAHPIPRMDHKGRTNIALSDPDTKEIKMIIRDQK